MTSTRSSQPRFMLDHMVIRLGKYLRIAGYDAVWDLHLRTHDLIQQANASGRLFITRNGHLAEQFPPATHSLLLKETDPVAQFHAVACALRLDTQAALFSRCIRCNVPLNAIDTKEAIRERVHPNVYARHDRYFGCPQCGTVFWHGSHVTNTCRKLDLAPPVLPASL